MLNLKVASHPLNSIARGSAYKNLPSTPAINLWYIASYFLSVYPQRFGISIQPEYASELGKQ